MEKTNYELTKKIQSLQKNPNENSSGYDYQEILNLKKENSKHTKTINDLKFYFPFQYFIIIKRKTIEDLEESLKNANGSSNFYDANEPNLLNFKKENSNQAKTINELR